MTRLLILLWVYFSFLIQGFSQCEGLPNLFQISGSFNTESGDPIHGIESLTFENTTDNTSTTATAFDQTYSRFLTYCGIGFNLKFNHPLKESNVKNGLTIGDLVVISKHILGVELLDSPYKIVAADINNSCALSTLDLIEFRNIILDINTSFSNNFNWRFFPTNFTFADPLDPFIDCLSNYDYPFESYQVPPPAMLVRDFIGIKVGDVNETVDPLMMPQGTGNESISTRAANLDGASTVIFPQISGKRGDRITIPMLANGNLDVLGFQFALQFAPEFLSFNGAFGTTRLEFSNDHMGLKRVDQGEIRVCWHDLTVQGVSFSQNEALLNFEFEVLQDFESLDQLLHINESIMPTELVTEQMEIFSIQAEFDTNAAIDQLLTWAVFPNPFQQETSISIQSQDAQQGIIQVFNMQGSLVVQQSIQIMPGRSIIALKEGANLEAGAYVITATFENAYLTDRMIKID